MAVEDAAAGAGAAEERVARGGAFVLQAEAPLARLIGYRGWLAEWMEGGVPQLKVWLSRYLAVDDDGPRAA